MNKHIKRSIKAILYILILLLVFIVASYSRDISYINAVSIKENNNIASVNEYNDNFDNVRYFFYEVTKDKVTLDNFKKNYESIIDLNITTMDFMIYIEKEKHISTESEKFISQINYDKYYNMYLSEKNKKNDINIIIEKYELSEQQIKEIIIMSSMKYFINYPKRTNVNDSLKVIIKDELILPYWMYYLD